MGGQSQDRLRFIKSNLVGSTRISDKKARLCLINELFHWAFIVEEFRTMYYLHQSDLSY